MLINFSLENYKSYNQAQTFTMVPGRYRSKNNHVIRNTSANVLKFSSIYGGNASGKSNIVDAIDKTKELILKGALSPSQKDLFFKLDEIKSNRPSNFEFKILINSRVFIYGFSISFASEILNSEYLYESRNKREELIFDFDYQGKKLDFNFGNINHEDNKKKVEVYQDDFYYKNSEFFLSFLNKIKFVEEQWIKDVKSVFQWFKSTLTVLRPNSRPIDIIGLFNDNYSDDEYVSIIDLIQSFDTGITDFNKKTLQFEEFKNELQSLIPREQGSNIEELFEDISGMDDKSNFNIVVGDKYYRAQRKAEEIIFESLSFEHCNNSCTEFEFGEESDGTKRVIELVNLLYSVQFKNRVFIVDELNRSLHPNLTVDFIEKFIELSGETESQLIVTNHDSALMDFEIVRQDEIWIVDRAANGESNLFSLSRYNLRSDKVLDKDYRNGRYGGIPRINKL